MEQEQKVEETLTLTPEQQEQLKDNPPILAGNLDGGIPVKEDVSIPVSFKPLSQDASLGEVINKVNMIITLLNEMQIAFVNPDEERVSRLMGILDWFTPTTEELEGK
jgi:hypothetical protein